MPPALPLTLLVLSAPALADSCRRTPLGFTRSPGGLVVEAQIISANPVAGRGEHRYRARVQRVWPETTSITIDPALGPVVEFDAPLAIGASRGVILEDGAHLVIGLHERAGRWRTSACAVARTPARRRQVIAALGRGWRWSTQARWWTPTAPNLRDLVVESLTHLRRWSKRHLRRALRTR